MFSVSLTAVFTPLSYPVLTALVQPQKHFLTLAFGFSFMLLARHCSCHSSYSRQSCSLPQYLATLPPEQSLGTVKETSYTTLAPGSLKKVTSQRPDPSWDLPGAGQGWQKNFNMYFFQTSPLSYCTHHCNVALISRAKLMSERLLSAFLPFPAPDGSAYKLAGTGVVSHHFLVQSLAQRDSDLRRSKPCCINS